VDLARPHIDLPAQPPDWVVRQLDAEGSAQTPGRSLQAQRAAQDQAIQNLRSKIGALPLSDGLTVADAAKADQRIAGAIDRAMFRARVYKVDFDPDGRVTVRVGLEARDVWDEIVLER
jgi:hypothetical protein